ncbi:MAG: ribosome maturation factor RimM [Pseudomonadota bacterium]|nr:ribosome maturation factor RimM [Pseudomonadota bacterium]
MPDTTPAVTVPVGPVPAARVQLGVIGRAHGVRGLVKVTSHTSDPAALTDYGPLFDAAGRCYVLRWKAEGVAEVSRIIDGAAVKVSDRSAAEKLTNTPLFVDRSALPPAGEDEYYLSDLIGLVAADPAGTAIGKVSFVHDYGAGASLEIQRSAGASQLIPFTAACVPAVDLVGGRLVVVLPDADTIVPPDADTIVPGDADSFAPETAGILAPAPVKDAQA